MFYIHSFNTSEEEESAYSLKGGGYKEPWVSNVVGTTSVKYSQDVPSPSMSLTINRSAEGKAYICTSSGWVSYLPAVISALEYVRVNGNFVNIEELSEDNGQVALNKGDNIIEYKFVNDELPARLLGNTYHTIHHVQFNKNTFCDGQHVLRNNTWKCDVNLAQMDDFAYLSTYFMIKGSFSAKTDGTYPIFVWPKVCKSGALKYKNWGVSSSAYQVGGTAEYMVFPAPVTYYWGSVGTINYDDSTIPDSAKRHTMNNEPTLRSKTIYVPEAEIENYQKSLFLPTTKRDYQFLPIEGNLDPVTYHLLS